MASNTQPHTKSQLDKFKDAARDLKTDDREEAFDEKLKKLGGQKRDPKIIGKRINPSE